MVNPGSQDLIMLIESQEYRCGLTGVLLTPSTASIDHMVPCSRGGEHVIDNMMAVHTDVNRSKATSTTDEFIGMCAAVVSMAAGERVDVDFLRDKWLAENDGS